MVNPQLTATGVRLAEVVGSLSLVTDLATGQPLEHGLRRAMLSVWLGEDLGLGGEELSDAYYVALLGTVGCTLEMTAFAPIVQDEIALGAKIVALDTARPIEMAGFFMRHAGAGDPPIERLRKLMAAAGAGPIGFQTICHDVAVRVGDMIQIGPAVRQALGQCHERWDGKGGPQRLEGEQVVLAARIFHVAHDADVFNRLGGIDAVISVMRQRSGSLYDPRIAARFRELAPRLIPRLESEATWDAALELEPAPVRWLSQKALDDMAQTIANFIDARSPYTLGHSKGVATLAESAARGLGLSETDGTAVRRAGLLHDMGRAGVPVAVWDKPSPLTEAEWERVKRHPSLTELVLARSSTLGHLGTLAGLHHERLDGSGYRGVPGSFLSVAAQVLAAADTYRTKIEPRSYRPALTAEAAAEEVQRLAKEGRIAGDVARAVLTAASHRVRPRMRGWPGGLSDREVEVLQLAARGLSNRQMAEILCVSSKTVGHHVQHIYDKIGVSTRVGATLFALQHGLLQDAAGEEASQVLDLE